MTVLDISNKGSNFSPFDMFPVMKHFLCDVFVVHEVDVREVGLAHYLIAHPSRRNRRYVPSGRRELVLRLDIFELRDLSMF